MTNLLQAPARLALAGLLVLLAGCDTVVMKPSGDVAAQQAQLIVASTLLMLLIIVPVIALTLLFAWRYRQSNASATYTPDWDHSTRLELVIWGAPLLIIIALGALTWISTHKLDPYRPLERIDAQRPVAAGMIYAMPGMETKLHAVMNKTGDFEGISANYSGAGFSDMRFRFHSLSDADFAAWVAKAKASGDTLSREDYLKLEQPSEKEPVHFYGSVAPSLYNAILNRCVESNRMCQSDMMAIDKQGGQGVVGTYNVTSLDAATRARVGLDTAGPRYVGALCVGTGSAGQPISPAGRPL